MHSVADRFREQRKARTAYHEQTYDQDRELAERMMDGDKEALIRLVDRHIGPTYKYLSRRAGPGNESLVAEVVEATFIEAFRRIQPYARGQAALPMRLRLIRLANKHLAKRRHRLVKGGPPGGKESEELATLRREMARLPMRQQAALSLALFEEMPPEEIGGALRTTAAGAMRLLRGALKRVGKRRQDEGFF